MKKIEDITIKRWKGHDWLEFKTIRLEAVKSYSHVFLSDFEKASSYDDEYWKDMLRDTDNGAVFGLYDGDISIGLTGVFRHREHKADTAILGMSYIREEYRGIGLSELLYIERIKWAKSQEGIKRIWVGHRAGNDASRRANQRHNFVLISTEDMTFGNGETDTHYTYELKI